MKCQEVKLYFIFVFVFIFLVIIFENLISSHRLKKYINKSCDSKDHYSLGDKLNAPLFFDRTWIGVDEMYSKKSLTKFCGSIGHLYHSFRPYGEDIPNIKRLKQSVELYMNLNNNKKFYNLIKLVENPRTLCIHVRSGDKGIVSDEYLYSIRKAVNDFENVLVICGLHNDTRFKKMKRSVQNMKTSIRKLNEIKKVKICKGTADEHLTLMYKAKNLMIHKGGFSTLGGLISSGHIFVTSEFEGIDNEKWLNKIDKHHLTHL